jgi:hypothetical protein
MLNIFANNFPTPDPKIVNFCVQIHNVRQLNVMNLNTKVDNFWVWSRKVICKDVYNTLSKLKNWVFTCCFLKPRRVGSNITFNVLVQLLFIQSCLVESCRVLPFLVESCRVLLSLVESCRALLVEPCRVLSSLVKSCRVLSLILQYNPVQYFQNNPQ